MGFQLAIVISSSLVMPPPAQLGPKARVSIYFVNCSAIPDLDEESAFSIFLAPNGQLYGYRSHGISISNEAIAGPEDESVCVIQLFLESQADTSAATLAAALERIKAAASPRKQTIVYVNLCMRGLQRRVWKW